MVINSIFDGRNSINGGRNTQSKGKESREEERKLEETRLDNTPLIAPLQVAMMSQKRKEYVRPKRIVFRFWIGSY